MNQVIRIFPVNLRDKIEQAFRTIGQVEEIRIRIGQPFTFWDGKKEYYLHDGITSVWEEGIRATQSDLQCMLAFMNQYSPYAYIEERRAGYLTIEGGHRIGMAGKVRYEKGQVMDITDVCFINIRIAHEHPGCAKDLLNYLMTENRLENTLILSSPGVGKTTILRDCVRLLSKRGMRVGVVDERSEIAACYHGIPQMDVGPRTDVLDGCGKQEGIRMLLRAMAPQTIAVDELGTPGDEIALLRAANCGCRLLGTMHGDGIEELREKRKANRWLFGDFFTRYVCLEKTEQVRNFHVFDGEEKQLC